MSLDPPEQHRISSSFRDPAGFVFLREGVVHRSVSPAYAGEYRRLIECGLYQDLVERGWLVAHEELSERDAIILRPDQVPYVSYPYEWSFSQYQAAARLTLNVQKLALRHDMCLKDASAYNVQFFGCRPRFIDTLSFAPLDATSPWVAYRQFCEHFLGPLTLMSSVDPSLHALVAVHLEGIPLAVTSRLLPWTSYLRYSTLAHLHLHARSQARHGDDASNADGPARKARMNRRMHEALIESLLRAVNRCSVPQTKTQWSHYYDTTNYSDLAMDAKQAIVARWLEQHARPGETVHDLGANTGRFSTIAALSGHYVVAHDVDGAAVERHYLARRREDTSDMVLPLVLDLTRPSPAIGWALGERSSFPERCARSFVLALALVHHIAIGNNTPLPQVSAFLATIASRLVIEFVPKSDSQVVRMLATREDIFTGSDAAGFESAFAAHFRLLDRKPVGESGRTLYLYENRMLE
jgi:hypothetical protein